MLLCDENHKKGGFCRFCKLGLKRPPRLSIFPRMRITFITNPHTCNQSCDICFTKQMPLNWEQTREMDFTLIEKTVKAFLPHGLKEIIPSTIGEPFLYSRFEDFLKLAKKQNIKVNITTNGTFPNGGIEKWIPLLQPVLSDIKFSAMHGKIPQSISEFINRATNCSITIQATLGKNDKLDEIPKGVNRIKINEPWILKNNSQFSILNSPPSQIHHAPLNRGGSYHCRAHQ
jgi:pyruvate-formate lyase-activating enzyme